MVRWLSIETSTAGHRSCGPTVLGLSVTVPARLSTSLIQNADTP